MATKGIFTILIILACASSLLHAQAPSNDNATNNTSLVVNGSCTSGTNSNATTESGEVTSLPCVSGNTSSTVWYSFIATASKMWVQIYKTSLAGNGNGYNKNRWSVEVYKSNVYPPPSNAQLGCATTNTVGNGDDIMELIFTNLTKGSKYQIQVGYKPGNGDQVPNFCIQVGSNFTSSCSTCNNSCGSACNFTYKPTTSEVTGTCSPRNMLPYLEGNQTTSDCYSFVAQKESMNFGLISNSTCSSSPSYTWTLSNSICGQTQSGTNSSTIFSGLTVGQTYNVCYTLTVPQDCYVTSLYPYVYPNVGLPVELVTFSGSQEDDNIVLNWNTESEINSDYFVIQRSTDGVVFNDIAYVTGNGTSAYAHHYSYIDSTPGNGYNYYRLLQVDYQATEPDVVYLENGTSNASLEGDKTGLFRYSNMISVEFTTAEEYHFQLNPTSAQIDLYQQVPASIIVFDVNGVVVFREVVSGAAKVMIPTSGKNGIWYACMIRGAKKELIAAF